MFFRVLITDDYFDRPVFRQLTFGTVLQFFEQGAYIIAV